MTAVDILTRRASKSMYEMSADEGYAHYISAIIESGNVIALKVKRADLLDHLSRNCPAHLRPRYEAALEAVEAALHHKGGRS